MVRVSNSSPNAVTIERPFQSEANEALLLLDAFDILSGRLETALSPMVLRKSRLFIIYGSALCLNGGNSFQGRIEIEIDEGFRISVRQFAQHTEKIPPEPYSDPWDQSWGE
jgi:hypothetical protein